MTEAGQSQEFLEKIFHLTEKGTTIKREILAGITTFVAVAYVIVVIPNIISLTGIPKEPVIAATILSTAITTLMMGLYANCPVALAPGLGGNAFFTYYICGTLKLPWQTALGAVFISGMVFLILTVCKARQAIICSIPDGLKSSIGVGIGLFIAFIGFKGAGIIVRDEANLMALGSLTAPTTLAATAGLFVTAVLMAKKINWAMIAGILFTTVLGMVCGLCPAPKSMADIISFNIPSMAGTFGQLDIAGAVEYGLFAVIFSFTVADLFDTMGTLIGVTTKAGMVKENGEIENLDQAMQVDSVGTILGSIFGVPTVTSYLESVVGVMTGGRTGLTAVVVAVCFFLSIFLAPLVTLIPGFATAPVLILVGSLMLSGISGIKFDDYTETLPAFMTIIMMPLTSSIATGFAFGFISHTVLKVCTGKAGEITPVMWIVSAAFLINLVIR